MILSGVVSGMSFVKGGLVSRQLQLISLKKTLGKIMIVLEGNGIRDLFSPQSIHMYDFTAHLIPDIGCKLFNCSVNLE